MRTSIITLALALLALHGALAQSDNKAEARKLAIDGIHKVDAGELDAGLELLQRAEGLDPANDETHGLLQMDSTAQYGYGLSHEGPVSSWPWESVVSDQNPWNTYEHAGLPASPIANPSDAAIKAAQNPAEGPWFYFVTVNLDTGETVFSETYAEQQAAEAEYAKWCEANPESGCY